MIHLHGALGLLYRNSNQLTRLLEIRETGGSPLPSPPFIDQWLHEVDEASQIELPASPVIQIPIEMAPSPPIHILTLSEIEVESDRMEEDDADFLDRFPRPPNTRPGIPLRFTSDIEAELALLDDAPPSPPSRSRISDAEVEAARAAGRALRQTLMNEILASRPSQPTRPQGPIAALRALIHRSEQQRSQQREPNVQSMLGDGSEGSGRAPTRSIYQLSERQLRGLQRIVEMRMVTVVRAEVLVFERYSRGVSFQRCLEVLVQGRGVPRDVMMRCG